MKPQRWHCQWWAGFDSTVYWQKNKNRLPNVGSVPFAVVSTAAITLHFTQVTKGGVANTIYFLIFQAAWRWSWSFSASCRIWKASLSPTFTPACHYFAPANSTRVLQRDLSGHWPAENHFCFSCKERNFYCPLCLFWLNLISGIRVPVIEFLIY